MKENEQIIEATGWHVWCSGDGIKKVDRCIRLGEYWHYHVIEDEEGEPADEWSADYEQLGTDPLIFETKELADKEQERQDETFSIDQEARQAKEDAEDAPLVEKLASLPIRRIQRIVGKSNSDLVAVWSSQKSEWESTEQALSLIHTGHITHTVKGKKTIIPLGSIDSIALEGDTTRVTTKSGDSYLYEGKGKYEVFYNALTIFNWKAPF